MLQHVDEWDAEAGRATCRKCCVLYAALSREAAGAGQPLLWRIKPKMHMFQEMAEYQALELGHPSRWWTYMDESFVGEVANMATSRGGPKAAATTSKRTMQRYIALAC